jgi:signal transduction histidine kinase
MTERRFPGLTTRRRLTLWYGAALAAVAAIVAIAGYSLVRRVTLSASDETLTQVVTAVGDALELESREHPLDGRTIPLVLREFRFPDMTTAVLDLKGDTLYSSSDVIEGDARASDTVRVLAQRANPNSDTLTDHLVDSTTTDVQHHSLPGPVELRLATVERQAAGRRFRVGALRVLSSREHILARLRLWLLGATPVLILLAMFGGNVLADAAFEQQRQFVADASHELRTPVSIVSGEAQLALSRDDRSPGELRASLQNIRRESERLQRIVADLFLLARADAREPLVSMAPVYLGEVAAECVASASTLAAARNITIRYEGPLDLPVRADEAMLGRLILNLIDNAIKYTPPGGSVTVSARTVGESHELRVADTGPGIPAEAQSRIFERFYRGDAPRRRGPAGDAISTGAGLGLAIAQWIAGAHKGKLQLERTGPTGSTFLLTLPLQT